MVQPGLTVQVLQLGSSLVAPVPQSDLQPGGRIPEANAILEDPVFTICSATVKLSYVESLHVFLSDLSIARNVFKAQSPVIVPSPKSVLATLTYVS
jgi:hypothetical protein